MKHEAQEEHSQPVRVRALKRVMPSSKGSLGVMGLEKSPGVQSMELNDQIHNQSDKL